MSCNSPTTPCVKGWEWWTSQIRFLSPEPEIPEKSWHWHNLDLDSPLWHEDLDTYGRFTRILAFDILEHLRSPWDFLDSADEYGALFERAGFTVLSCDIETVHQPMTPEKVFDVFNSGAAAGYLNQQYFSTQLPEGFGGQVVSMPVQLAR